MLVQCHNCGQEDLDRWMHRIFTGGTKPMYLCDECYKLGIAKVDENLIRHYNKSKRDRLNGVKK